MSEPKKPKLSEVAPDEPARFPKGNSAKELKQLSDWLRKRGDVYYFFRRKDK